MRHALRWLITPREGKRFRTLLGMLFVMVILMPLGGDDVGGGYRIVNLLFILMLLSAVYAVGTTRRRFMVALLLVIAGQVANFVPGEGAAIAEAVLTIAFMVYCCLQMLGYVLSDGRVTTDKLLASLCLYMLMALTFAVAYEAIELARPGSIVGFDHDTPDAHPTFAQAAYFSFVTQTTLGYGDLTPTATPAGRQVRTLIILQAVIGQLYLTVLVARLVALHIAHRPQRVPSEESEDDPPASP